MDKMFKEFMFGSFANFQMVVLTCLFIFFGIMTITFVKALSFCQSKAATTSATLMAWMGQTQPVTMPEKANTISEAIRITKVVAIFVANMEICVVLILLLGL